MIGELADTNIQEMRALQPQGPFVLGGYCFGGEVVLEMARRLRAERETVGLVAIFQTYRPGSIHMTGFRRIRQHADKMIHANSGRRLAYLIARLKNMTFRLGRHLNPILDRLLFQPKRHTDGSLAFYPGRITLFRPREHPDDLYHDPQKEWCSMAAEIKVYEIPGDRTTAFKEPHVCMLGEQLSRCLDEASLSDSLVQALA